MKSIIEKILVASSLTDQSIAIKKYGSRREIKYIELIEALIIGRSIVTAANTLGITEPTLESQLYKHVKKDFPDKLPSEKWGLYFLSRISYRQCNKCFHIGHRDTDFYVGINNICKSCSNTQSLKYRTEHREELRTAAQEYRDTHKDSLYIYYHSPEYKARKREYRKNNPGITKAGNAKRREAEINATRKYDYGDQEELDIIAFYDNCPEGYHVDHIVPLQHSLVCGLHTLANLQYLSAKDNLSKGNKFYIE